MHARRILAAATLVVGNLTLPTTTALAEMVTAPNPSPGVAVTDENDCFELAITRQGDLAATREAVPARYSLTTVLGGTASALWLHTYTCRDLTVDGQPAVGGNGETTVTIGSVQVNKRDEDTLTGFNTYVLWYGTDNPVLFAKFQQLGLPARLLPRGVSATIDQGATQSIVDWAFNVPGLTYKVHAVGSVVPLAPPGKISMWFDGPRADLKLTYLNDAAQPSTLAPTEADLTGVEPLVALLRRDANGNPIGTILPAPGVPVARQNYGQGSWQACLGFVVGLDQVDCPAAFS